MIKDCQARSRVAQEHHFALCMTAYIALDRESKEKGMTIYKLKRRLSSRRRQPPVSRFFCGVGWFLHYRIWKGLKELRNFS